MGTKLTSCFVLCAAAAAISPGGCVPKEREDLALKTWVVSDMVALTDKTRQFRDFSIFDAEARAVNLHAAANETVSFQIVVDGGQSGVNQLTIAWSDLVGTKDEKIDKSNVSVFRGVPVEVSDYPPWYLRLVDAVPRPAGFYDPLVPIDAPTAGQPFDLGADQRLALWVDVSVPRSAKAGDYRGELTIIAANHEDWTATLAVEVHDFVLPDARPIAAVGGFDHAELFAAFLSRDGKPYVPQRLDRRQQLVRSGLVIMRQLMTLAHQHRLDLFDKRIRPVMKRDMFGRVSLEWEDYDAIVMPYLDGTAFDDRLGVAAWPVPFSQDWPDPEKYNGAHSDAYATTVGGLLTECRRHLARSPEPAYRRFIWPYRLGVSAEAYDKYVQLARLVRAADSETPLLCQLPANPPALTGWTVTEEFKTLVDISAPPAQWLDPGAAGAAAKAGHPLVGLWLSPGQPPYLPSMGVIATPADVRVTPWFALKYGCVGLFLPEVLHWSDDPFGSQASDQTRLFYPGTIAGLQRPLPSVRLKRLRRGLQDAAYLWLLRQRGRGEVAGAITDGMARYAGLKAVGDNYLDPRLDGWVQDRGVWHQARRLMAAEISQLLHPSADAENKLLERRLAWQRFDEQAHRVRIEQVRSRVAPPQDSPEGRQDVLEITILLDLQNEYGRNVDVTARIELLPAGWRAVKSPVRLSPFRAGRRAVAALKARGTYVPATADAKLRVPLSITVDMSRRQIAEAAVPFMIAGRVTKPPRIDGVLDDWPMRVGNAAGAFKLIGRRGQTGDGLAVRQTNALVLTDKNNLYIAFRCREPDLQAMVFRPNNLLHYEQLMACGEDLVEVILDPGADARGPEDLYHIAVKPNGILLTEQGIHTEPPLGRAKPWPVSASVAVGRQKEAWVVELAIPLDAFGTEGNARFWGINFTRFATQNAEASSWSGAPRHFYDPRNLGTMFIPGATEQRPGGVR